MKVFCVHFLFIRNGQLVEMPPRTVEKLEEAGVVITLNGKPESTQIQMNWEPAPDGTTWTGRNRNELVSTGNKDRYGKIS